MGLSVEKVGLFCNPSVKRANNVEKTNTAINLSENKEINLNNSPNNISFSGFFFNRKKNKEVETPKEPEPLFGPYNLTQGILDLNDKTVWGLLAPVSESLSKNNPQNLSSFSYDSHRATDKAINAMVPVCISLLTCYPKTYSTYPEFYDSIARAFPKACSELDDRKDTNNMSKVYFKVREKIEEYGKIANPEGEDCFEDGIKYLFFATNIPLLKENGQAGIKCTRHVFEAMNEGYIPKLSKKCGLPRCSMSRVSNEINEYGTPYIKESFYTSKVIDRGEEPKYKNLCHYTSNENYTYYTEPQPKIEEDTSSSDDYIYISGLDPFFDRHGI